MTAPEVTVVIPTRNRLGLLRTTLATVRAQEDVITDVVIVDDGSEPAHAPGIAELAGNNVRVIRNGSSRGVAAARNQGIAAARAPWVAFLDDDDLWTPDKLRNQLTALAQQQRAWAYTGAVKFAIGPILWQVMSPPAPEEVFRRLATKCVIPAGASNVIADVRTVRTLGGFDESLAHMADWDMWLRLLETGLPAAAAGIGVGYRLHPNSMSLNPQGMLSEVAVLDRRWRHVRGGAALDPGPTHLWIAMSWLRARQRRRAAASYLRAARTLPREGVRGLLRTLHPEPPRPAHVTELPPRSVLGLKRFKQVDLPPGTARMLAEWGTTEPGIHATGSQRRRR